MFCFKLSSSLSSSLTSLFFLYPLRFHFFFFDILSSLLLFILKGFAPLAFHLLMPITNSSFTSSHFFTYTSHNSFYFSIAISAQCFFKNCLSCKVSQFYDSQIKAFYHNTSLGVSIVRTPFNMKTIGTGKPSHRNIFKPSSYVQIINFSLFFSPIKALIHSSGSNVPSWLQGCQNINSAAKTAPWALGPIDFNSFIIQLVTFNLI